MDEIERIESLATILEEFDLDAVRIRVGDTEIELIRRSATPSTPTVAVPVATSGSALSAGAPAPSVAAHAASATAKKVLAPVVGVFYRSSSPGSEPFVELGQRVEAGQTVCILEAMKMFNEITTDFAGVVTRIVPENGELVSLGEEMFWIEP